MYYEEKIIDGRLHFRTTPDGEWRILSTTKAVIVNLLMEFSENDRLDVFSHFCSSCGTDDPSCQCWNDE